MMDWNRIDLVNYAKDKTGSDKVLNEDQFASLTALNHQLKSHNAIIADEVGTGKTRIACALIDYVCNTPGGRAAVVIPPGLIAQWIKEYRAFGGKNKPIVIRNLWDLFANFDAIIQNDTHTNTPIFLSQTFEFARIREGDGSKWKYYLPAIIMSLKYQGEDEKILKSIKKSKKFVKKIKKCWEECEFKVMMQWASFLSKKCVVNEKWNFPLTDYNQYSRWKDGYKLMVTEIIPTMFGCLDLIILDEAHKGKDDGSRINRILKILDSAGDQRFVGMTATPIELDSEQWIGIFDKLRIFKGGENKDDAEAIIKEYTKKMKSLPSITTDEMLREFGMASEKFEKLIGKYTTRRKRIIDPEFIVKARKELNSFNQHHNWDASIGKLDLKDRSPEDQNKLFFRECISESLNGLKVENNRAKMLDYTYSRGLDNFGGELKTAIDSLKKQSDYSQHKRQYDRTVFWLEKTYAAPSPMWEHLKIRRAIKIIEQKSSSGYKVLVFGCFSNLIRTLRTCLNVRYVLNTLKQEKKARVPDEMLSNGNSSQDKWMLNDDNMALIKYEMGQLKINWADDVLFEKLRTTKAWYENTFRREIRADVSNAISAMFDELGEKKEKLTTIITARMCDELLFAGETKFSKKIFNELAEEIKEDSCNVDKDDNDEDNDANTKEWEFLEDEKNLTGSDYSMLFEGLTSQQRRAIIQTEFNRHEGFPRVLIAQTTVGKEGLNLHKSCRTIVFLTADWNPGTIEQQIGRVDRINSLWEKDKDDFLHGNKECPFIELISIEFDGTYDSTQWNKLIERRNTLKYQLYGSLNDDDRWPPEIRQGIMDAMPNLTPAKYIKREKVK